VKLVVRMDQNFFLSPVFSPSDRFAARSFPTPNRLPPYPPPPSMAEKPVQRSCPRGGSVSQQADGNTRLLFFAVVLCDVSTFGYSFGSLLFSPGTSFPYRVPMILFLRA